MTAAVIVAAGSSSRMGVDKLFLEIAGKPLIAHTWQRFDSSPVVDEIVLVVRADKREAFAALAAKLSLAKPWRLAEGGAERQDSVMNGLNALSPGAEIAAIHDGARPCASHQLIAEVSRVARESGAAVAAQKVTDTLKESRDGRTITRNVDRALLWAVQTPQAFRVEIIRRALAAVRESGAVVTDDTAACEWIGQPVALVESGSPNPKATTKADIAFIEMLLRQDNAPSNAVCR